MYLHRNAASAIASLLLVGGLCALAQEEPLNDPFPFIAQQAENEASSHMCLGLAGSIECLEEAKAVTGTETSMDLALRIWSRISHSEKADDVFRYSRMLELRDGTTVPSCSTEAIEELGFLVQDEYRYLVETTLWRSDVSVPDPFTVEGRKILKARQRYRNLHDHERNDRISSKQALRNCFRQGDKDGLVAFSGHGQRVFLAKIPTGITSQPLLTFDPATGKHVATTMSRHAFLLTYDEPNDQFHVYDSDDSSRRWPVTVKGDGLCPFRDRQFHQCRGFRITWRIDDHMGNGPSQQIYCDVRPLETMLESIRTIVDDADR